MMLLLLASLLPLSPTFAAPAALPDAEDQPCKAPPCSTLDADPFNARIAVQVAADGRFNIGAFPDASGGRGPNSWDLMYSWPGGLGTSFTTIRVDGVDTVYGSGGTRLQPPTDSDKTNTSRWQIGDIEVTQVLQIVPNNQTGQEDIVKIAYTMRNTGTAAHTVGSRVMIDTELNYNDGAPFRIPGAGIVTTEKEFTGALVPDSFLAFFNVTDSTHVAVSTLRSGGATAPDRLVLASWPGIRSTLYDYTVDTNRSFSSDSAYAVYWNPAPLAPGEVRTYATLYGLAQVTADLRPPLALNVDSPATLSVVNNQYSPNPFTVVATVLNNGTATATNVQLTLNLPAGLSLVNGSLAQSIGDLPVGQEQQLVWTVQASPQQNQTTLTLSVTATASNADTKQVSRTLTVPALTLPTGPQPPRHTTSYYMQNAEVNRAIQLGCDVRVRGETGLVVLDFGSPVSWQSSSFGPPVTRYGARLIQVGRLVSTDDIALAVLGFAIGYVQPFARWNNYTCSGLPVSPSQLQAPNLSIAVGISNSALFSRRTGTWRDNPDLNASHGAAWAGMLNTIDNLLRTTRFINRQPVRLYPFVGVSASYDSEYYQTPIGDTRDPRTGRRTNVSRDADQWSTYPPTLAWADSYDQTERQTRRLRLYNFGSCESCPRTGDPNTWKPLVNGQRQSTTASQTLDRMYHLTWELYTAYPLPQIYHTPYPNEWYNVRWYVNSIYRRNMSFSGVMTQCGSSGCSTADTGRLQTYNCAPNGLSCSGDWARFQCPTSGPCPNFPPSQGWQALYDTISASVTPYGAVNNDIRPQTRLDWVTDIRFQP